MFSFRFSISLAIFLLPPKSCVNFPYTGLGYTLNTPGSAWPGKGSIGAKLLSGSTITRKSVNLTRNMTQSDPIICQFDWFPGHRWPEMEFGPNGPFSGSRLTRVFLECIFSYITDLSHKQSRRKKVCARFTGRGNNSALFWQKEASNKSPKSEKGVFLDWTQRVILSVRVLSRDTHHERY